jgi:hypothetical protein
MAESFVASLLRQLDVKSPRTTALLIFLGAGALTLSLLVPPRQRVDQGPPVVAAPHPLTAADTATVLWTYLSSRNGPLMQTGAVDYGPNGQFYRAYIKPAKPQKSMFGNAR